MSDDNEDVVLEIRIDAAPETVFALLTDPTHMTTWFAELVEADPRPGGVFRISGPAGVSIEGTYVEVIANRKVVFTWGGVEGLTPGQSTVEFLLEPDGEGTLVRLRHYGLPGPTIESHRRGWVYSGLAKLKDAAEGRRPTRQCLSDLAERRGGLSEHGAPSMNWWMLAGGMMALICAVGRAIAVRSVLYQSIKTDLRSELHAGLFTAVWDIITINVTMSAIALVALSASAHGNALAWLVAAQFAGYATVYLSVSLRLAGALNLFQWIPFGATAILSALHALIPCAASLRTSSRIVDIAASPAP